MNKVKSIKINAFLNGLRSVLNLIFPLITFPYVSRVLSVNGMGIYNFSNTYISYFILIAGLGINTYAVREGAKFRRDEEKIRSFSNQLFSINIISTVIAYLLLILTLILFHSLSNYVSCILIFSLQILFTTIGTEWLYIIYEEYAYITIRSIIFKIFSIALLFILVKTPNDYLIYAGITVFAGVGSNILNYIHAKSFVSIKFTLKINWNYHLKPILIIFAATVATTIYVYSDNTILGLLKGDYDVGIYSIAVKIYTIAQSLLTAILTVTIPRLAFLYGQKLMVEYKKLLRQVTDMLVILALPAATGLMMLSKEIVLLIASEKYLPSVTSLRIISWAIIFSIFSWFFSDCVLIPAKRESYIFKSTLITAILNIILNLLLIPHGSYNAAALCTVISEFLVMILNGYFCRDIIGPIIFSKSSMSNVCTSILGCVGIIVTCRLIMQITNSFILVIILSVIISGIIYFAILIILRNAIVINYIKQYLTRMEK